MAAPAEPPPVVSERPMYCKEKVYCGVEEFSLEEIRACKWTRRHQILQEEMRVKGKLG